MILEREITNDQIIIGKGSLIKIEDMSHELKKHRSMRQKKHEEEKRRGNGKRTFYIATFLHKVGRPCLSLDYLFFQL